MASLEDLLAEIEAKVVAVEVQDAEEQMTQLLRTIGDQELRVWEIDLRKTIQAFLPKRRKRLLEELERCLRRAPAGEAEPPTPAGASADLGDLVETLKTQLDELSRHQIFQWATSYRDSLGTLFDQFVDSLSAMDGDRRVPLEEVRRAFRDHSAEIFQKGFNHLNRTSNASHEIAIAKGLSGQQRFLDLPLEFYSARIYAAREQRTSAVLRETLSSMVAGIIAGFSKVDFVGIETGSDVLSANLGLWAHVMPFMLASDLTELADCFVDEVGAARIAIDGLVPALRAIDDLLYESTETSAIPSLSFFNDAALNFEISLSNPTIDSSLSKIKLQVFLDPNRVTMGVLREAGRRDTSLVLAPLRPDVRSAVEADERVRTFVVDATQGKVRKTTKDALDFEIYRQRSARHAAQPLQYNFAGDFPLHNPFLTRYVHVHRSSVRELARTFERRNGVRVWCSVRRSGKTTSCLDLGASGGDSTFVVQTCAATKQIANGTVFYERFDEALRSGQPLAPDFFAQSVKTCAPDADSSRFAFVLDEYETLFGRLRGAARADDSIRFSVIQPLLDQMVAFTQDNLLVFLGQQPDAHYSFMEQNQLSAYVEQDSFPLFRRSDTSGVEDEFSQLINRVFADRAGFDSSFSDELFAETAGHPYLTVKLLVVFVDYLIERGTPAGSLFLTGGHISEFRRDVFSRKSHFGRNQSYDFFREAIAEATSDDARDRSPWLHAIYSLMRAIARTSPDSLTVSLGDFEDLFESLELDELGFSPDHLLASGAQANFFHDLEDSVAVMIPLLGRIAAAARTRVS